jgi:alcohol dehydrogenase class IV
MPVIPIGIAMQEPVPGTSAGIAVEAYDLALPPTILFGAGRVGEIAGVAAGLGRVAWIVGGRRSLVNSGLLARLEADLGTVGLAARLVATTAGEPTVDQVAAAVAGLPAAGRGEAVVIAVGGGAAIDLAKAIAALATNLPPDTTDFDAAVVDRLEGVGRGLSISVPPLPVVAVPTTAGTGAEATRNAVISCPRRRFKKSMRSPLMVPRAAVVDPLLTVSCDRGTTAASGLDAITQLVESFVCRFARPVPRALAIEALPRALAALPVAVERPTDAGARAAMSHAALVSGIALANSGLGMAHGVAAALGIECGTPHGLACATLLPVAVRVNLEAAECGFATLERAADADASTVDREAAAAFAARIEALCDRMAVPRRLRDLGLARDRLGWLAENSGGASMRGNPVALDPGRLLPILEAAY